MRSGALALALTLVGCGNPLDVSLFPVDLTGDPVVSPSSPGKFTVTARNTSNERIVWGMGSSSCQLGLIAIVDGIRQNIDWRACTTDLVEQALDPGESRTEEIEWDGHIPDVEGRPFLLPEGRYRLIGVAGSEAESEPIVVTVTR